VNCFQQRKEKRKKKKKKVPSRKTLTLNLQQE
jgi:hypothetical protein